MKKLLPLALMGALTVSESALDAQAQNPGAVTGTVLQANGVISGSVASSSGRRLSDLTVRLVDARRVVVGTTKAADSGEFTFPPVPYDTYTLECVQKDDVIGTASVILKVAKESVKLTCTSDVIAWWKKKGVLTALVAAATAVGATAVVATNGDASGAR